MAMVVKNNMGAVKTLNTLNKNSKALSKSLAKVSSGMKITDAADDASGYSISERMRVQIRGLEQDVQNTQNATSLMRVAEGAVSSTVDLLKTLKEKAINAANDTNTDKDRAIIQKEINQSLDQIDDNANVTFNGKYLLNGAMGANIIASAHDSLLSFMSFLNSETHSGVEYDDAVRFASGGLFEDAAALQNAYLRDIQEAGNADVFLQKYCGIDLSNDDTGAITGMDAGGDRVKTAESIVPESGNPYVGGVPMGSSVINGLTVNWPTSYGTGASQEAAKKIASALESQWLKNAMDLVTESYALSFQDTDTMVRTMAVRFEDDPSSNNLAFVASLISGDQTTDLALFVNMAYFTNMDWSSPSGKSESQGYLDRTIAHEMTHALMFANIKNFVSLPQYVLEGTAELVHGIDDFRKTKIRDLADASNISSVENVFETDPFTGSLTEDTYAVGYTIMRYMAKQSADAGPLAKAVFQVGTKANQAITIGLGNIDSVALGLARSDGAQVSVATQAKASSAITVFDYAINKALKLQTYIGAVESRLAYTSANLTTASENVQSSESTIRDADMAKEMTAYTKNNVLLQAAQSMLAQANQSASSVLSLLQ